MKVLISRQTQKCLMPWRGIPPFSSTKRAHTEYLLGVACYLQYSSRSILFFAPSFCADGASADGEDPPRTAPELLGSVGWLLGRETAKRNAQW